MEKTRDFVYNQCKTRGHQFRIDQSQQLFASYCFKRVISRVISRKIHDFTWFHYNDKKKAKNHQIKTSDFTSDDFTHSTIIIKKEKVCRDEKTKKFFNQASDFSVKITRDFFERSVKKKNHSECHIKKNIAEQCMCVLDLAVNFTEKKSNKKIWVEIEKQDLPVYTFNIS